MKIKKLILLIVCFSILTTTACQKTPSTTPIDNSNVTKETLATDSSINTKETLATDSPVDIKDLEIIKLNEEKVDEVLNCGEVSVTLKGTVSKPDTLEGLYIYKADIVDYNEYEKNMTFLFGEYENLIYREERSKHLKYHDGEQWGYSAYIVNSSLYDEKSFTGSWGSIFFTRERKPLEEKIKVDMTNDEAKAQADEIINRIGVKSFQHYQTIYKEEVLQVTPEGTLGAPHGDTLTVVYAQYLQGIPVFSVDFQRQAPHVNVTFYYEGVLGVSISEYTYEAYAPIERCISYEEALEKFKTAISQDKDCNGLVFDSVKFEYSLIKEYINGNLEIRAVPYWHFYYEGIPGAIVNGVDVKVNAINGRVTR